MNNFHQIQVSIDHKCFKCINGKPNWAHLKLDNTLTTIAFKCINEKPNWAHLKIDNILGYDWIKKNKQVKQ